MPANAFEMKLSNRPIRGWHGRKRAGFRADGFFRDPFSVPEARTCGLRATKIAAARRRPRCSAPSPLASMMFRWCFVPPPKHHRRRLFFPSWNPKNLVSFVQVGAGGAGHRARHRRDGIEARRLHAEQALVVRVLHLPRPAVRPSIPIVNKWIFSQKDDNLG